MTIEIIGRSSIAPGAPTIEALQQILKEGRCTVTQIPDERWNLARYWHPVIGTPGKTYSYAAGVLDDIYLFDPAAFGLSAREAMQMDPQQRILLGLVWRALEDANIAFSALSSERVGVYVGASSLDHGNLAVEDAASGSPYFMTGNTLSLVSNRISHIFGLRGPSMTIDTACSSSLVALDQAVKALEHGEIDTAIVGGVNILAHPLSFVGFAQARMLSPEGLCRAYDNNGHGYVRAEGGAAIILRRTDRALQEKDRSYARIHATGVNSSGRTNGISLPSREAQTALLRSIYEGSNIDVNRVAFVEGHGTGTKVGDPAEVWAIGNVIGKGRRAPVPIGSIKSNIGHTEPASGLFGLLKAMISLDNNFLPASLHVVKANEEIDFEALNVRINATSIDLLPAKGLRYAGINSFGFGGTNAHVVISDPEPVAPPEPSNKTGDTIFLASAHSASALSSLLADYKKLLVNAEPKQARQIVSAAAVNRPVMRHRFAVKANDSQTVLDAIDAHLSGNPSSGQQGDFPGQFVKTAFVFSGNGSQWAGMGVAAYQENSHFRQCFQSFSALFEYHIGEKLTDLLISRDLPERLADTKIAQPLLFALQASLSDCLVASGVKPHAVFGHSVGEIAAAYAARALTAAEAVAVVSKRSQQQDLLAGEGKMAAVVLNAGAALAFAKSQGLDDICIAAVNASNSVTISGPSEQIELFREAARKSQIVSHILDINYPFHHPIIDRAKSAFLADLPDIEPDSGNCNFVSTVTGATYDGKGLDANYWWRNVREPVLFQAACEQAIDFGCNLFIEISPRPILSNYVVETATRLTFQAAVIPSFMQEKSVAGRDPVAMSIARAVAHGVSPIHSRSSVGRNAFVNLPRLPFERIELRQQSTSEEINIFGRDKKSPYTLLGWRIDPHGSSWQNHLDAHLFADLAEHVVDSKAIMPGSGFIEIAVAAVREYYNTQNAEITNLEILRPMELRLDRLVELSTILSPETGDIEIRSRERLSNDAWTVHAVARGRKPIETFIDMPYERPTGERGRIITMEETYETARRFGLQYGSRFHLLSKAVAYGRSLIEVDLKAAGPPSHPYVTYHMHPISIDAAFHGLVALFDQLSGDAFGAPYIPVRFGKVRVSGRGGPIASASIQVERFSNHSIKVRFLLLDADGMQVAAFDDCRFRRAFLSRHHSLDAVGYHYEAIPTDILGLKSSAPVKISDRRLLLRAGQTSPLNNATLLLDAAIYRACHEIALAVSDSKTSVSVRHLPGDSEFRAFITNCLYILEDAGITTAKDGRWFVPPTFTLPSVPELLQEVYHEAAGRVAEAVLVNEAYRNALDRIDLLGKGGVLAPNDAAKGLTSATVDHFLVHSPLSYKRQSAVIDAVQAAFDANPGSIRHVYEAGTTSSAFSRKLATIAADNGAVLLVVEPREALRRTLELSFEKDAHVVVTDLDGITQRSPAELIVTAGDQSQRLMSEDERLRAAISASVKQGARLIFADRAPSVFNDFAFGLSDGWFSSSQSDEFPVGRLATSHQVEDMMRILGFEEPHVEEQSQAEGSLIVAIAMSSGESKEQQAKSAHKPFLVVSESGSADVFQNRVLPTMAGQAAYAAALPEDAQTGIRILYHAGKTQRTDVSAIMQERLQTLAAICNAVAAIPRNSDPAHHKRPRMVILAPGGSPVAGKHTDETNAGLWSLARVLQNEYEFLDIHLLDIEKADVSSLKPINTIFTVDASNREWVVADNGEVSELRVTPGPFILSEETRADFAAATIRQYSSSRVDSIGWEQCALPIPLADEVVIEVGATGLNFRDVMWAMGVLSEEALEEGFAGATIGMELAGRVVSVGSDVHDLVAGDKVMGIGPAAFSTHAKVRRIGITKIADDMNLLAAATVPVAFLTAYYAMIELGHIQAGETILIHGAAGGVGLAALQIAKMRGAKIIATAGTLEKRRLLEMLGADHVFDSRSLDFVEQVRAVTEGAGVDLVLNSLFSEAMERSIELVKPFGRFLELGKRDYYSDRKIGLRPFRRNISYFGIDADQLLVSAPALTTRIFTEIRRLFADGKLTPLPYRCFNHDEIGSAFRLMQNAGHIGKIVVRPPSAGIDRVRSAPGLPVRLNDDGVFLVAGGIGGFGLAAADWLVSKGARRVALCSRKGVADEETIRAIAHWKKQGAVASLHACDITDEGAVGALLESLRTDGAIKGIIHAAMVLDDALLTNLTPERNPPVVDVKVNGADILHRLTQKDDLELFLLFSSVTTMIGNPGQANYVAANGYLEGLARTRRSAGLPALAVGFGAISDKGFLARNTDVNDILSKRVGKTAMKAREALEQMERYIVADPQTVDAAAVVIADIDWSAIRLLPIGDKAIFEVVTRHASSSQNANAADGMDLRALIKGKSDAEAQAILHAIVAAEIAAILRVTDSDIGPSKVLKDIGLDSLMAMELGMSFQQKTGFDIPLSGVGDGTTVGDVVTRLRERVSSHGSPEEQASKNDGDAVLDQLFRSHSVPQQKAAHNL